MDERQKLKQFIEEHIPFDALKKVGYWEKGTRRTDYEKIAERVCRHFGYQTIYEYHTISEIHEIPEAHSVVGKFRDKVDEKGNFVQGGGFHLSIGRTQTHFECPHCTCNQELKGHNKPAFTQQCKGCKRKLSICEDYAGNIHISEK